MALGRTGYYVVCGAISMTESEPLCNRHRSVRFLRPFDDHMKNLYQQIDNAVYSALIRCDKKGVGLACCMPEQQCSFQAQGFDNRDVVICKAVRIRLVIGEHFEQHDVMEETK